MRRMGAFALLLLLSVLPAWSSSFVMDYYAVRIDVDRARGMVIRENFSMEYTEPSHGFYRDIQYRFPDGTKADVEMLGASTEDIAVEDDGTFMSLRIGDPETLLISGPYAYSIEYAYDLGGDRYSDYDEVYYNIVAPDSWDSDIETLVFSITLPYPIDPERVWLTAGGYGSTFELPFVLSDDGCTVSGRYKSLPKGYGMTIRIEMDDGYFNEAVVPVDYASIGYCVAILISIIFLVFAIIVWLRKGRDGKVIAPVRFSPPEGLSPLDVGFILDGCVEDRAVSAMLVYWADKGWITIEEKDGGFAFSKVAEPEAMSDAEQSLFEAFFASSDAVDVKTLAGNGFYGRRQRAAATEAAAFTGGKSLIEPSSERLGRIMCAILVVPAILSAISLTIPFIGGITLFVALAFMMMYAFFTAIAKSIEKKARGGGIKPSMLLPALPFIIFFCFFISMALAGLPGNPMLRTTAACISVASLFSSILISSSISRRSAYAEEKLMEIYGYREFIETVEKDRIERLSAEDPAFYYHVLSYAMAMGVEDQWTRAFDDIYVEPASWYIGGMHDAFAVSRFARRWVYVSRSTLQPPRQMRGGARTSRGSSGFSGGGFSGGGGRSW